MINLQSLLKRKKRALYKIHIVFTDPLNDAKRVDFSLDYIIPQMEQL